MKPTDAVIERAVFDLIGRDAEPIFERWFRKYVSTHGREPTDREIDEEAKRVVTTLTADKSRYYFSNLRPVWNLDGKTWRLEHKQGRD